MQRDIWVYDSMIFYTAVVNEQKFVQKIAMNVIHVRKILSPFFFDFQIPMFSWRYIISEAYV